MGATALGFSIAPSAHAAATFSANGSIRQVYVLGAPAGQAITLRDGGGTVVGSGVVDSLGSWLARGLTPGPGFTVSIGAETSDPLTVLDETPPAQSFYDAQTLAPGFGYIQTRDGTLLSATITLPGPAENGPYPTVVEYSGYGPSDPNSPPQDITISKYLGFATVSVNVRGTGCSGGAFDLFEPLQRYDGYDVIEAVAAQPWSANVGMIGISYPGIEQLYVASTRPPSLKAIAPMSTFADGIGGLLYPGGIRNKGFATGWVTERDNETTPNRTSWVRNRIANGDTVCDANRKLSLQSLKTAPRLRQNLYVDTYPDIVVDNYLTADMVGDINVPTFLTGAWQDEQTGPYFATMLNRFSPNIPFYATVTNGTHVEGLLSSIVTRWIEFLQIYVGEQSPFVPATLKFGIPEEYKGLLGISDRANLIPELNPRDTPLATAKARYEQERGIRVIWENGGQTARPGYPYGRFESHFGSWPITDTGQRWYLHEGTLDQTAPTNADGAAGDASGYMYRPAEQPLNSLGLGTEDAWKVLPPYHWNTAADSNFASFVSSPLTSDVAILGTSSVDVWVRSTAPNVDLEAVITEVRPDGKEVFVQSGWMRADRRELATGSTDMRPLHTHLTADAKPLPASEFDLVRFELFPVGHIFRAGSKLRVMIQAPGGNQANWEFDALDAPADTLNLIGHSIGRPSSINLPVIPLTIPPLVRSLPACPGLRGQPCRTYVAHAPLAFTTTTTSSMSSTSSTSSTLSSSSSALSSTSATGSDATDSATTISTSTVAESSATNSITPDWLAGEAARVFSAAPPGMPPATPARPMGTAPSFTGSRTTRGVAIGVLAVMLGLALVSFTRRTGRRSR